VEKLGGAGFGWMIDLCTGTNEIKHVILAQNHGLDHTFTLSSCRDFHRVVMPATATA
jgi:hypothetical protein